MTKRENPLTSKAAQKEAREQRLAQTLRENLRKRKAAARKSKTES